MGALCVAQVRGGNRCTGTVNRYTSVSCSTGSFAVHKLLSSQLLEVFGPSLHYTRIPCSPILLALCTRRTQHVAAYTSAAAATTLTSRTSTCGVQLHLPLPCCAGCTQLACGDASSCKCKTASLAAHSQATDVCKQPYGLLNMDAWCRILGCKRRGSSQRHTPTAHNGAHAGLLQAAIGPDKASTRSMPA